VSTLADQVGSCALLLRPLYDLSAPAYSPPRGVHTNDTTASVLATQQTCNGPDERDDRRFADQVRQRRCSDPRRRASLAPRLYGTCWKPGAITETACCDAGLATYECSATLTPV
jgi:hypothetical protein